MRDDERLFVGDAGMIVAARRDAEARRIICCRRFDPVARDRI